MSDGEILASSPDGCRHLHGAARVCRHEQLGPRGQHIVRLPVTELLGRFRLQQVVDARRAATDISFGDLSQLQPLGSRAAASWAATPARD